MALKTFNVDSETYKLFSEHCKKSGISMSKKVEIFMKEEVEKIKSSIPKEFLGFKDLKNEKIKLEKENSFRKYC